VRVVKSKKIRWRGIGNYRGEGKRNAKAFLSKPERKRPLEETWHT
jgi:hypothetical protein